MRIRRSQAAKRYGVHERTISRWEADKGFPQSIVENGRHYYDVAALDAWDARPRALQKPLGSINLQPAE